MNLRLDVVKSADGAYVMHVEVSVMGEGSGRFVVPLGNDLLYAIYKGINLELAHLDCVLSEAGVKAKAEAESGSKEQTQDVGECAITEAADSVCA